MELMLDQAWQLSRSADSAVLTRAATIPGDDPVFAAPHYAYDGGPDMPMSEITTRWTSPICQHFWPAMEEDIITVL
jgi:hypothetical protein